MCFLLLLLFSFFLRLKSFCTEHPPTAAEGFRLLWKKTQKGERKSIYSVVVCLFFLSLEEEEEEERI